MTPAITQLCEDGVSRYTESDEQRTACLKAFYAGVAELREADRKIWAGHADVVVSTRESDAEWDYRTGQTGGVAI